MFFIEGAVHQVMFWNSFVLCCFLCGVPDVSFCTYCSPAGRHLTCPCRDCTNTLCPVCPPCQHPRIANTHAMPTSTQRQTQVDRGGAAECQSTRERRGHPWGRRRAPARHGHAQPRRCVRGCTSSGRTVRVVHTSVCKIACVDAPLDAI